MSFRGGGRSRGGPARSRGRFRGRSRERSMSRDRMRHRNIRSRSRDRRPSRERFVSPPRRNRVERGRSFERERFRSPLADHPTFEENFRPPRFEPREEGQFEYSSMEMAPMEGFVQMEVVERSRERGPDIEGRRGTPNWRVMSPGRRFSPERREAEFTRTRPEDQKDIRYSPNIFEGKDPQDKPDPWANSTATGQTIPSFGQEKSSSLVPEYNPDNVHLTARAFLKHLERVANEQKWNDEDKKFHFSAKLTGSAKEWFISGNKILDSWPQIRKTFLKAFPSEMEYFALLDSMMKRMKTPDEDLSTYFNYKMVLLNNCKITGKKAVSCLIGGLSDVNPLLKEEALEHNFSTPEELYEFLKDKDVDNMKKIFQKPKKKCYRCGNYGHVAFDCPKPKDLTEKSSKHIKEEKIPKYKDVTLFGWFSKAIFDDSYPHITVRESDIDNLKVKYKRQVSIIDGCNGMKLTSLGQAMVHLKVDHLNTDVSVHVVKDQTQTVPIILGKSMRRYAHYIEDRNGVHFSPLDKGGSEGRRRSLSPNNRKDGRGARSPNRHVSPPRNFKESHPFLSKFYGNPY